MVKLGIAGYSGSGKTTLVTRLIPALMARGLTVSTVKHTHHSVHLDRRGDASRRLTAAGAKEVAISTPERWARLRELFTAAAAAFGLAAASFFPILVLGIFSRRTTKEGAIAGMLTGIGFTAAYIVWFRFLATDAGTDDWLFGISPEGIGAVGMLLNFAVTLAVSHATAPPPAHVQAMVDEIRLPGGHSDEGT